MTKVDIKLITRVITIICGGLIITLGILRFINMNYTLSKTHYILMTIYLSIILTIYCKRILAIILVLSEFQIKYLITEFAMLASLFGRGVFSGL